jgi:RND family efflux transporter MFP subunit
MKRIILITILLASVGSIVAVLMSNRQQQQTQLAQSRKPLPVTVSTMPVRRETIRQTADYTGTTEAWRELAMTATTQGIVRDLNATLNGSVRAGQVLARVDTDLNRIALTAAVAQLRKARADAARFVALERQNNATATDVETAQVQVEMAESQVQTLQKQLRDATVLAPIGGTVTEKSVERGMFIAPGSPLLTITDVSAVRLVIGVAEAELPLFRPGRSVGVRFDAYPGASFGGTVHLIRIKGAEVGRFPVEIRVVGRAGRPLRVGMTAIVSLPDAVVRSGLMIPRTALVTRSQTPAVFVLQGKTVRLRPIETGSTFGSKLLITNGLRENEQLITSGTDELRDGERAKE